MKKLIALIATTCLALSLVIVGVGYSHASNDFNPEAKKKNITTSATSDVSSILNVPQYGRFICEEVGINVGMYNSNSQAVCDAVDSACFYDNSYTGMIIADHAGQGFRPLTNVTAGMMAQIVTTNNGIITLQCVDVLDGHNTKSSITDNEYVTVFGTADLISYTCLDSTGKDVRICKWNIVSATGITAKYNKQFSIDGTFSSKCTAIQNTTKNIKDNGKKK